MFPLFFFICESFLCTVHMRLYVLKGIDRPFSGRVESRLIRSVLVNWRLGKFFYLILKGLHHKISKKPLAAA
jgi:hypothetical protein